MAFARVRLVTVRPRRRRRPGQHGVAQRCDKAAACPFPRCETAEPGYRSSSSSTGADESCSMRRGQEPKTNSRGQPGSPALGWPSGNNRSGSGRSNSRMRTKPALRSSFPSASGKPSKPNSPRTANGSANSRRGFPSNSTGPRESPPHGQPRSEPQGSPAPRPMECPCFQLGNREEVRIVLVVVVHGEFQPGDSRAENEAPEHASSGRESQATRDASSSSNAEPGIPRSIRKPRLAGLSVSGRRASNPRPSAWEADALPTELRPRVLATG
jgi:hypothetical protein